MNLPTIIFLALFGISSIIHLIFCKLENELGRKISKPFCLTFLSIAIICLVPDYPLIFLFPIFSLIGDILLIFKKRHYFFLLGNVAFFIGHLCILAQIICFLINSGNSLHPSIYVLVAIVLLVISIVAYPYVSRFVGRIALLGDVYLPMLIVISFFAIILAAALEKGYLAVLVSAGYILFTISDGLIVLKMATRKNENHHFNVMITYLAAELMITLGMSYLVISGLCC